MARKTFFTGLVGTQRGFMTGKNGIQAAAKLLDQPLLRLHRTRITSGYCAVSQHYPSDPAQR
jgi:hypothetical protein